MKIHCRLRFRCRLTALLALIGVAPTSLAADATHVARALVQVPVAAALPTPQQYIGGFVLYVRWPGDKAISTSRSAIKAWQICVAAPADASDARYAGMVVRERPFVVRHVTPGDALGSCHVLDLTVTDPATTAGFLKTAQAQRGLLIVGDGKDFCSAGGLICLRLRESRGGFEINLSAVKNAGFIVNAKLLMMARQADAEGTSP